jgi:nucleotide-binding universal stress UspA family protein
VGYKSLLLHLSQTPALNENRIAATGDLARRFSSHVAALQISLPWYAPNLAGDIGGLALAPDLIDGLRENFQATQSKVIAAVKSRVEECLNAPDLPLEWRAIDASDPEAVLSQHARYADLTILGISVDEDVAPIHPDRIAVLSGRPVLVVPNEGTVQPIGRSVLIAWNGSREASMAVAAAMPFLETAETIRILTIAEPSDSKNPLSPSPEQLALNLTRHGLRVSCERIVPEAGQSSTDLLTGYAQSFGADLMVMGFYSSHTRLRELILGGVTRSLLTAPPLPLLGML